MVTEVNKVFKILLKIFFIVSIIILAFALTPKTFQNDTFYTIKIGELIDNTTEHKSDLLPWNGGLDMKDHFSYHNLPYTYPHWLYDFITYKVYQNGGFNGIYVLTCVLSILMGLAIYFINVRLNRSHIVSYLITIGSLICLKNFIAARAQLVTFILFAVTIFCIEMFVKKKSLLCAVILVIISLLIANLHCAVWPFYFVLYLPYLASYLITNAIYFDYKNHFKRLRARLLKKKLTKEQYKEQMDLLKQKIKSHSEYMDNLCVKTRKLEVARNRNIKYLFIVMLICGLVGMCTPIKEVPYTYLVKTMQGDTTKSISEHQPLVLVDNEKMIVILAMVFTILIFSKSKIRMCDFFMIMGLIALSFISQRQVSMLVLIGNFVLVRWICSIVDRMKIFILKRKCNETVEDYRLIKNLIVLFVVVNVGIISYQKYLDVKNNPFVDEKSYPVEASNYIKNSLIPSVGKENIRLYNEYNYGSYLLFKDIPVFIDSRADLYAPEFNGKKSSDGKYKGNDIFSDFLGIDNLSEDYEDKFEEYRITHVITYRNSKLSSLLDKDGNYTRLYSDKNFKIYERECSYE